MLVFAVKSLVRSCKANETNLQIYGSAFIQIKFYMAAY